MTVLFSVFPDLAVDVRQSKDPDDGDDPSHERVDDPVVARRPANGTPTEDVSQKSNGDGEVALLETLQSSSGYDVGGLYRIALLEYGGDFGLRHVLALVARARDGAGVDDMNFHVLRVYLELLDQGVGEST